MAYAGNSQVERTQAGSANFVNSILGVNRRSQLLDEEEGILDITSGTTHYIRDPSGAILGQLRTDSTGVLVSTHYFGTDALGSVRHVTDSKGNQKNSYRFGPYGETVAASEEIYNPWRFTGQYDDDPNTTAGSTSALYKMGMRYYQPGQHRWTQRDPLNQIANVANPPDANPYAYAGSTPSTTQTPRALEPQSKDSFCASSQAGAAASDVATIVGAVTVAAAAAGDPVPGDEVLIGGAFLLTMSATRSLQKDLDVFVRECL